MMEFTLEITLKNKFRDQKNTNSISLLFLLAICEKIWMYLKSNWFKGIIEK